MKTSKKYTLILLLHKNKAVFYSKKMSSAMSVAFPESAVKNLEIISADEFERCLVDFIQKNNMYPSQVYIILGNDVIFRKELFGIPKADKNETIESFLSIVPFESILGKEFHIKKESFYVAANKELCERLIQILRAQKCQINGIIPLCIIQSGLSLKQEPEISTIFKKIHSFKSYNLSTRSKKHSHKSNYSATETNKVRLVVLLGIFCLLALMLYVIIRSEFYNAKNKQLPSKIIISPTQTVITNIPTILTITPITTEILSPTHSTTKNLKQQVITPIVTIMP